MKPDYYIHVHTRECTGVQNDGVNDVPVRVKRRRGEHVMTYRIWALMKVKDVAAIIGPLAKDVK